MKCIYQKIECNWSIPIGDINCSECIHYGKKKEKQTPEEMKKVLMDIFFAPPKRPKPPIEIIIKIKRSWYQIWPFIFFD